MINVILQYLELDLVNVNQYKCVCKLVSKDIKRFKSYMSLFSEFEPRQNLDHSQMSYDNLMGYIMSISMCMHNFIRRFHSVQEIGPFSYFFFKIWSSAKPRTMKNVISQPLWLDLVNISVYAKVYQNNPLCSRDRAIFTFSEFEPWQRFDQS